MSDEFIALIATIVIIALLFAWVPILDLVCPPCGRALARYRLIGRSRTGRSRQPVAISEKSI